MTHPRDLRWGPIDYVYTLPDGSKVTETILYNKDHGDFMRKHNAVSGEPVRFLFDHPPCQRVATNEKA